MRRSTLLRVGIGIVAVLVASAAGVAVKDKLAADDPTLVGYFADASPLDPGSQVRASGVMVGNVRDITLDHGRARVTFNVNPSVLPVHRDARLTIRPVNLLGEHYVELDSGSSSQPFMENAVISVERTESSVDLQDVINTFDNPTSTALAAVVTTLGEGMRGSGQEAAAAIKALAPAMQHVNVLGGVLRDQNVVLNQLIDRARPVADALAADNGRSMGRLVGSTERTLSTLAANQRAFDSSMAELPGTLAEARRTLKNLTAVSGAATPVLESVRPVTDNLTEITGELQAFSDAADPAFASLPAVLERGDKLLDRAIPVVAQLRKAGPDLRGTAKNLRPVGNELLGQHLGDLMAFVKKWSLSTNSRDALGHYFRGVVHVTPRTLQDLSKSILPGTDPDDNMRLHPGRALRDTNKILSNLLPDGSGEEPGNVTGLTPKQEHSMLGQLLGGL